MGLNPIQTGGAVMNARTFNVYNVFNKQAKATKLGDFSENLSGTIWCSKSFSVKIDVTMATTF